MSSTNKDQQQQGGINIPSISTQDLLPQQQQQQQQQQQMQQDPGRPHVPASMSAHGGIHSGLDAVVAAMSLPSQMSGHPQQQQQQQQHPVGTGEGNPSQGIPEMATAGALSQLTEQMAHHISGDGGDDADDSDDEDVDDEDEDEAENDGDWTDSFLDQKCKAHATRNPCKCKDKNCYINVPSWKAVARSFRAMKETDRINSVRLILFSLTAPPKEGKRSRVSKYMIRGRAVCRNAFVGIMQISDHSVTIQAKVLAGLKGFKAYSSKRAKSHRGCQSSRTKFIVGFLRSIAVQNAHSCWEITSNKHFKPILLFPRTLGKRALFLKFAQAYNCLPNSQKPLIKQRGSSDRVPAPAIGESNFYRIWNRHLPFFQVAKREEDYCTYCSLYLSSPTPSPSVRAAYSDHIRRAVIERKAFQHIRSLAYIQQWDCSFTHITFGFARNITLPSLRTCPAGLFFNTGLMVDFFGCSIANFHKQYTYTLVEGHWPGSKGMDAVTSMLHDLFERLELARPGSTRYMVLTGNTSSHEGSPSDGNRTLIKYLAWRLLTGQSKRIELRSMVSGHAQSPTDLGFAVLRRYLNEKNIHTPRELMRALNSLESAACIPGNIVRWRNWTQLFDHYFPGTPVGTSSFKDKHICYFTDGIKGKVTTAPYTTSPPTEQRELSVLGGVKWPKPGPAREKKAKEHTQDAMDNMVFVTPIMPLHMRPAEESLSATFDKDFKLNGAVASKKGGKKTKPGKRGARSSSSSEPATKTAHVSHGDGSQVMATSTSSATPSSSSTAGPAMTPSTSAATGPNTPQEGATPSALAVRAPEPSPQNRRAVLDSRIVQTFYGANKRFRDLYFGDGSDFLSIDADVPFEMTVTAGELVPYDLSVAPVTVDVLTGDEYHLVNQLGLEIESESQFFSTLRESLKGLDVKTLPGLVDVPDAQKH